MNRLSSGQKTIRPKARQGNSTVSNDAVSAGPNGISIAPPAREQNENQGAPGPVQAKLTIGPPDDRYEQEADRVASQVMHTLASAQLSQESLQRPEAPKFTNPANPAISALQRSPSPMRSGRETVDSGEISRDLEYAVNSVRGGGQPLGVEIRRAMGEAMGADFKNVRVHMDSQSDRLNQSLQAKAFTVGRDVFFQQGAYEPATTGGQALIAHELAHVVQQSKGDGQPATAQRALKIDWKNTKKELGFIDAFDINGNPHLATKGEDPPEYWQFKTDELTTAVSDKVLELVKDVTIEGTEENKNKIFHNLSRGRQQEVKFGKHVGVYEPFKSWIFGFDKRPDVAVYDREEQGTGASYKSFYTDITNTVTKLGPTLPGKKDLGKKLESIKGKMMLVVWGEEFRTPGAEAHFNLRWDEMLDALANKPLDKEMGSKNLVYKLTKEMSSAIGRATVKLDFAGEGGKEKFRTLETGRRKEETEEMVLEESLFRVTGTPASPVRSNDNTEWVDPGIKWKKRKVEKEEDKPTKKKESVEPKKKSEEPKKKKKQGKKKY